jgi:hypothetical protein
MSKEQTEPTMNLIFVYTRKQAIEDGVLIDITNTAKEAGLRFPTAITSTAWSEYVAVPHGVMGQDEDGRLWDIVWMLRFAIAQQQADGPQILFELLVKNEEHRPPQPVTLKAIVGPGDDPRPVITIMMPHED